jgi:hypothetical protein
MQDRLQGKYSNNGALTKQYLRRPPHARHRGSRWRYVRVHVHDELHPRCRLTNILLASSFQIIDHFNFLDA